jgi:hypothetical protein
VQGKNRLAEFEIHNNQRRGRKKALVVCVCFSVSHFFASLRSTSWRCRRRRPRPRGSGLRTRRNKKVKTKVKCQPFVEPALFCPGTLSQSPNALEYIKTEIKTEADDSDCASVASSSDHDSSPAKQLNRSISDIVLPESGEGEQEDERTKSEPVAGPSGTTAPVSRSSSVDLALPSTSSSSAQDPPLSEREKWRLKERKKQEMEKEEREKMQ